ncbi:protein of unknown function [Solimonas aquatica]|uniref:DUF4340 domain-containing protein n=1 Tax=Solimonas aquatica TaxID=489703 RepID=A0A1H9EMY4_9GAMM|nr:DUF4340 domain-containing protein [Solimonas aquatica]SEQ26985.1 protein of unknown function [Solimonas aquatica]
MKRARLNLLLLVLVAALAATVYFTRKKEEPKGAPLTALNTDAIDRIRIEHPDRPALQLEKRGSDWWLSAPVSAPCDPFEVATLLNLASASTQRSFKLSEVKPAELKLDPPQFSITLNDQKLAFGDVEPLEYRRYVQHGDTVSLIDDPAATSVDADYSDLLAKTLLPSDARLVAIQLPGLSLKRDADGKRWQAEPAPAAASADDLSRLVEAWRHARAMWNAAIPAQAAQSGQTPQPITLSLEGGQTIQLLLISREPQLIIDRPDLKVRYTLSKADADTLLSLKPAAAAKP